MHEYEHYEAIVVGAGPGGAAAAAVLAQNDIETIVLERGIESGSKNVSGGLIYAEKSSPYTIENLSWSTTYNLEIYTFTQHGESSTPFEFSIGPENSPTQIQGLVAEAGEASIALSWDAESYSSTYNIYFIHWQICNK